MTIVLTVKVHDGVILAADSATSVIEADPSGSFILSNVYNNASKIFNLYRGLPIGGVTWGCGSIGHASISALAKDLRRRFAGEAPRSPDWKLAPAAYPVKEVSLAARRFLFEKTSEPM